MKKLASAILITGLTFSSICTGSADAMTGNTLESVKALQKGDQEIEGVTINQTMEEVFQHKGQGIHTKEAYGNDHYYEYHDDFGLMIVTADGPGKNAKVKRISISYQKLNGPKYNDVKKQVHPSAITREHYSRYTGNSGYISDGHVSYQFASKSPKDKILKLYRIDLEAK